MLRNRVQLHSAESLPPDEMFMTNSHKEVDNQFQEVSKSFRKKFLWGFSFGVKKKETFLYTLQILSDENKNQTQKLNENIDSFKVK